MNQTGLATPPGIQLGALGVTRPSSFSPLDLSPVLWLDGSDAATLFTDAGKTTPVSSDGDVVGAWADKSGNVNDALQTVTASKPLYKTGIQNTLSSVLFDGGDDYLANLAFSALTQPNTIVIVGRMNNAEGDAATFYDGIAGAARHALLSRTADTPDGWAMFANTLFIPGVPLPKNQFVLFEAVFNGSSSAMYQNGALVASAGNVGPATLTGLLLGALSGFQLHLDGYISEITLIDGLLTSPERTSMNSYENAKWSIF